MTEPTPKPMLQLGNPSTDELMIHSQEFDPPNCPTCGQKIQAVTQGRLGPTEPVRPPTARPCGHELQSASVRVTWME